MLSTVNLHPYIGVGDIPYIFACTLVFIFLMFSCIVLYEMWRCGNLVGAQLRDWSLHDCKTGKARYLSTTFWSNCHLIRHKKWYNLSNDVDIKYHALKTGLVHHHAIVCGLVEAEYGSVAAFDEVVRTVRQCKLDPNLKASSFKF